ncbi:uncharacterized protein LOC111048870 [Nilaparvata lugens]|uniref:uncharacterized protein LOC111048870 n=1 Tax=Nilaparvata lugens TaxID=108931 RepID=UPI00193DF9D8|nr:uncharacterized protein LOC111048870 [Nilaparvata lugens]
MRAIYPKEWRVEERIKRSFSLRFYFLTLYIRLPLEYPSVAPSTYALSAPELKPKEKGELAMKLDQIYLYDQDRFTTPDIEAATKLLKDNKIWSAVEHYIDYYHEPLRQPWSHCSYCGRKFSGNSDTGPSSVGSGRLTMKVDGAVVVVTRWYGIQLGQDRFKHYNGAARTVLKDLGSA